jgi:hypothetical protein
MLAGVAKSKSKVEMEENERDNERLRGLRISVPWRVTGVACRTLWAARRWAALTCCVAIRTLPLLRASLFTSGSNVRQQESIPTCHNGRGEINRRGDALVLSF